MDNRRYQSTFSNSSSSSAHDQPGPHTPYDNSPQSTGSYRQPTAGSEYYVASYASVPAAYDQSGMAQAQPMPVPSYGIPSPLDTSIPSGGLNSSIPGTPRDTYHMLGSDKSVSHYDHHHHVGKSELERQMSHEYQQTATSHGMAMTSAAAPYVQGWQPGMTRQNNAWDYKYYGHQT